MMWLRRVIICVFIYACLILLALRKDNGGKSKLQTTKVSKPILNSSKKVKESLNWCVCFDQHHHVR